mmetsp:Transcript_81461/g.242799  ORF Transcript_81461/g.242799 Transcript_81461/m.242799 type:complete len:295 (-) Transcript_81461:19-903(-)
MLVEDLDGAFPLVFRGCVQWGQAVCILGVDVNTKANQVLQHVLAAVTCGVVAAVVAPEIQRVGVRVVLDEQLGNGHAVRTDGVAKASHTLLVLGIDLSLAGVRCGLCQVLLKLLDVPKLAGLLKRDRRLPDLLQRWLALAGDAAHLFAHLHHQQVVIVVLADPVHIVRLDVLEELLELRVLLQGLDLPREFVVPVVHHLLPDLGDGLHQHLLTHLVRVCGVLFQVPGLLRVALHVVLGLQPLGEAHVSVPHDLDVGAIAEVQRLRRQLRRHGELRHWTRHARRGVAGGQAGLQG